MRPRFTAEASLKKRAKEAVETGEVAARRWWCGKYNRPPNDPLYLSRSRASLNQEMYEDVYARKAEIEDRIERGDGDGGENLEALNAVKRALGEDEQAEDALWDQWEADLEAGRTPDLDAEVPRG